MGQGSVRNRLPLIQRSRSGQALNFVAKASARLAVETMGWDARADGRYKEQNDSSVGQRLCRETLLK